MSLFTLKSDIFPKCYVLLDLKEVLVPSKINVVSSGELWEYMLLCINFNQTLLVLIKLF